MDLEKMLVEAIAGASCHHEWEKPWISIARGGHMMTYQRVDLNAAAKAFLAKVREAEQPTIVSEIAMRHTANDPRVVISLSFSDHMAAFAFYNQTVRRRRETSLRLHLQADPDHADPVPPRIDAG